MKLSIMLAVAVLCSTSLAQSPATKAALTKPAGTQPVGVVTIGYDTTRITGPLKADGTVDYLAAVNAMASKGVTKYNNAALLLIEAVGPDVFEASVRAKGLKLLGMEEPKGPFLKTDFADNNTVEFAGKNLWQAKDYPELAAWLAENEKSLAMLTQASMRTRFFLPVMTRPEEPQYISLGPNLGDMRRGCRMLIVRANLAAAEGRMADGWADIQAVYRLSELVNQSPTYVGRLVATAIGTYGDEGTQSLAASGKLESKTARLLTLELASRRYEISVIPVCDECQRFWSLDLLSKMSIGRNVSAEIEKADSPEEKMLLVFRSDVDWNRILRETNRLHDEGIAILRNPNLAQREEQLVRRGKLLAKMKEGSHILPLLGLLASTEVKTRWVADSLIPNLVPVPEKAQRLVERGAMQRALSIQALALAAYKADKGKYPQKLDELTPVYLKELPRDFFGGKEFIYKPSGDGANYLLYSVGPNQIDDGGKYDGEKNLDDIFVTTQPERK